MAYDDSSAELPGGRDVAPRFVTAFFDTQEAADAARQDLVTQGVPSGDVRVAGGEATGAEPAHPHGFWESLKDFFVPDEDRHLYAEGLRRGGFALSVQTDSAAYDHVIDILDRDGAVDMEERAAGWRDEGWSAFGGAGSAGAGEMAYAPAGTATGGFTASRADQPLFDGPMDTAAIEPGQVAMSPADRSAAPGPADTPRDAISSPATLPAEPGGSSAKLARDLSHGRTRVRSYVGE